MSTTDDVEVDFLAPPHLNTITEAFRVGSTTKVSYLPDGLMNRNWHLSTDRGDYALKHITDIPASSARRNLRVLADLADRGVPTCRPLRTRDDDPVLVIDGHAYCLLPWIIGRHLPGPTLSPEQAAELGTELGRIHQALNHPLPPDGLVLADQSLRAAVTAPEDALATADRYLHAALAAQDAFGQQAVTLLQHRKRLIAAHATDRPTSDQPAGPVGWTHGDLQHRNVLWHQEHIAAVIDWDRIRIRPFAEEVARTATIQFGSEQGTLDLTRTAAFVSGYRSVITLSDDDLLDGLHRLWWKRMSDFWQLDFHYDRGDDSCDHLFLANEEFLHWWTSRRSEVQEAFGRGRR